jgi:hypothetical protein
MILMGSSNVGEAQARPKPMSRLAFYAAISMVSRWPTASV